MYIPILNWKLLLGSMDQKRHESQRERARGDRGRRGGLADGLVARGGVRGTEVAL